ncbi:hypothetical protein Pcinc_010956 [Petrolisthes cinctipes]|uniref:Secreted protein n=1 Tax=Petrolisthes cinctipes TaxID=88211 RepID=A0AAE1KWU7_PETCI|nr:hypothetical protein Pcinc_010956 [Petrolisthes cinctipes]
MCCDVYHVLFVFFLDVTGVKVGKVHVAGEMVYVTVGEIYHVNDVVHHVFDDIHHVIVLVHHATGVKDLVVVSQVVRPAPPTSCCSGD